MGNDTPLGGKRSRTCLLSSISQSLHHKISALYLMERTNASLENIYMHSTGARHTVWGQSPYMWYNSVLLFHPVPGGQQYVLSRDQSAFGVICDLLTK